MIAVTRGDVLCGRGFAHRTVENFAMPPEPSSPAGPIDPSVAVLFPGLVDGTGQPTDKKKDPPATAAPSPTTPVGPSVAPLYPGLVTPAQPSNTPTPQSTKDSPAGTGQSTQVSPYDIIGVGPDGKPLPDNGVSSKVVNPYDPTGELGITTNPGNPAATPLVPGKTTYSAEDIPKTTVPSDLASLAIPPSVTNEKPDSGGLVPTPSGVGVLGQLVLEMAPPGTKFEGETTIGPDGMPTTDWNVVVPGQEPTYWGKTQHVPLANGTSVDINYGANGTPLLAKGEGDPALRLRLADDNGAPRWAVLNSAGEYLFTIDSSGNKLGDRGSESNVGAGAGLAGLGVAGLGTGTLLESGALAGAGTAAVGTAEAGALGLAAALAEGAAVGAEAGALVGSPSGPGAAITAGIGVVVGLGLTYYMYQQGMLPGQSKNSEGGTSNRVDPNSLPEIGVPQPRATPPVAGPESSRPPTGLDAPTDPTPTPGPGGLNSPPVTQPTQSTRPSPADDPDTTHQQILFPSTKPGQPGVPVEGTFWDGNGILRNGPGNPRGQQPGSTAPRAKSPISLKAELFKLFTWDLEDVDEEYRPQLLGIMAFIDDAEAFRGALYGGLTQMAIANGADIDELVGGSKRSQEELDRLDDLGVSTDILEAAVDTWWKAQYPIDKAKELLGHAGAIAVLKSDGWEVNIRPEGGNKHDIVAYKDGQVMVIESKGGNPGKASPGEAQVPDGSGGQFLAQQMTDPYLWHKLRQDANNDPEFRQWLIDRGMLDAVMSEDPSKVGYRLIRTDTNGKIDVYGSTQTPVNDGIPDDVVVGQTTGNKPGTPEDGRNPRPTLHGVAQPLPLVLDTAVGSSFGALAGHVGSWINGLIENGRHDLTVLSNLTPVIPPVPILPHGLWTGYRDADQSLTFTLIPQVVLAKPVSKAEELACETYL